MAISSTVRASEAGIKKIDELRIKKGWNRKSHAFAEASHTSEATLGRFWARKPTRKECFIGILNAVGIEDWEQYVEQPAVNPSEAPIVDRPIVDGVPNLGSFYGRREELATLTQELLTNRRQIIGLLGMGGIGKTALAAKLVHQVKEKFDAVIWRSLRNAPSLSEFLLYLLEELIPDFIPSPSASNHQLIAKLLDQLACQRVLLIFDSWQNLLGGELAGIYRPEYADYGQLLAELGQHDHCSSILLISREKQANFTLIGTAPYAYPLKSLDLSAICQLLSSKGLILELRHAEELMLRYSGNPLALQLIGSMIRDYFGGNVGEFLRQPTIIVDDSFMETVLSQQMQYTNENEKRLLYILAQQEKAVDHALLQTLLGTLSISDFLNTLRSLERRSLIERGMEADLVIYTLQPMVRKYVNKYLKPKL